MRLISLLLVILLMGLLSAYAMGAFSSSPACRTTAAPSATTEMTIPSIDPLTGLPVEC